MEVGRREKASPGKPSKFAVYQNPALSAALTASSLQPSKSAILSIFFLSSASAFAFLSFIFRVDEFINYLRLKNLSNETAYLFTNCVKTVGGLGFIGAIIALLKAISLFRGSRSREVSASKDEPALTKHQLQLLGVKPKVNHVLPEPSKKPPKFRAPPSTPTKDVLVPLHQSIITSPSRSTRISSDRSNTSSGSKIRSFSTPTKSPSSSSSAYLVSGAVSPLSYSQHSPGLDVSSPWSNNKKSYSKGITSEEELEQFLVLMDERITESAGKHSTPTPTVNGFGIASPATVASSANTSGTTRNTPLRPVRMSPGSQKFSTPPKKGEGDLPSPMSMEESVEAFDQLGIYPEIESWRDRLRQWVSSVLLKPLLEKIESSHIQVMQSAAKLGVSITVNQVGSNRPATTTPTVSQIDRTKEWLPSFNVDEDGLLHQLRATLVQTIDSSTPKALFGNTQQTPPQNALIPLMQDCLDAITEHQRLLALMKGELIKGLLPQSSVPADYMVKRIRELAEGTCVKNYEYLGSGEAYDKVNKKWILELPSDSHLLLYLFCAFLEHPKWMLHVDPASYSGAQSSKNPLFLGVLPPKERFPEKYVAVISTVPSTIHPGACVLVVGRQSPPIFALYWEKNPQFSLQGRTALWDSILLICHKIKVSYGGIVRGMHLGSSALSILPVLDVDPEE